MEKPEKLWLDEVWEQMSYEVYFKVYHTEMWKKKFQILAGKQFPEGSHVSDR